jgi:Na+/proline symporter
MTIMQPLAAYILLALFAVTMITVTTLFSRRHLWQTAVGFMAAGRKVPWWLGAISLAITWIWAPALFVSVQQSYENGIAGIFWFTFPNILALIVIAPLAVKIRKYLPSGYSQPEWIRLRFDAKTHKMYLVPFFWYQLMAITVQLYAGGSIVSLLTGVRIEVVMTILALTTLIYSLISGMRASIVTDFLQYSLILLAGIFVIPWTIWAAGGLSSVTAGLGGITGQHHSIFDPQVAFNFGIVTSIGLLSGSLSDQQHWQRAFTIEQKGLVRAYIVSGFLFGIVPIAISLLGFIGANRAFGIKLPAGVDPSMIGIAVITHFLPAWAVISFLIMMLGGLCSTLDSGMCAASSLYALNCVRFTEAEDRVREKEGRGIALTADEQKIHDQLDRKIVGNGRAAMIGITIAGFLVALAVIYIPGFGLQYLWWIFNTVAACVAVPTILSLYWRRTGSTGVFWGVLIAFFVGIPVFVYSNIKGLIWLTVASSLGIVAITTLFALLFPRSEPFRLPSSVEAEPKTA